MEKIMKKYTEKLCAIAVAIVMLLATVCFVACSPYSGHYEQVAEDQLESKSDELKVRLNQTVNNMLWHDMMPNYKTVYTVNQKTTYNTPKFSTETKVKVVAYGYEGLTQSTIEYHEIKLVNDLEFSLFGADPILEEYNFTVTFWYGEELENIYYELVVDGKKEQDVLPYNYGRDELKMASQYDQFYHRYIKDDIATALTFDCKLYFDGEDKIKVDGRANDGLEKWNILAWLIFNDDDTV